MMYCKYCGKEIQEGSSFCSFCGKRVVTENSNNESGEGTFSFSCMLAYIPGLFWMPLISSNKDKKHKEAANQGLWISIFALIGMIMFAVFGLQIILNIDTLMKIIGILTSPWIGVNFIGNYFICIGLALVNFIVLFVPINSICGFFHCLKSTDAYKLPIVGRFHLIKA